MEEHHKLEKVLKEEVEKIWKVKATVVPVAIRELGIVTPKLGEWLQGIPGTNEELHPDQCSPGEGWDKTLIERTCGSSGSIFGSVVNHTYYQIDHKWLFFVVEMLSADALWSLQIIRINCLTALLWLFLFLYQMSDTFLSNIRACVRFLDLLRLCVAALANLCPRSLWAWLCV